MIESLFARPLAPDREVPACALCGTMAQVPLFEGGDLLHPSAERFGLVACARCGHLYQSPRPIEAAIGRYYPEDYIAFYPAIADEPRLTTRLERRYGLHMRVDRVHRRAGGRAGRILDVGCATGVFLDGMRQRGWDAVGIELTESAAAYARERMGLTVHTGRLEDIDLPPQSFDVVSLWDVLEHVYDPRAVLAKAALLLRPGGLLVVSTPNPDCLEARLLGQYWLGWDLPRHINLFRPRQLATLLAEYQMPIERIESFTSGYSLLLMSLEQRWKAHGRERQRLLALLRSRPLRLLAKLYYSGPARQFNLSSAMVVFARRAASGA